MSERGFMLLLNVFFVRVLPHQSLAFSPDEKTLLVCSNRSQLVTIDAFNGTKESLESRLPGDDARHVPAAGQGCRAGGAHCSVEGFDFLFDCCPLSPTNVLLAVVFSCSSGRRARRFFLRVVVA